MNAAVFHQAVADGDATRVKFLINIGQQARVNQPNKHGYTALQQSCKDGRIEVVYVLLNHGANINSRGRKGRTALHLASAGGYTDIVELLITSCADLSVKDNEGNLPVDVAKTEQISKLLSSAEAEKKAKSVEANKKSNSEEWSQTFKSLPAGSRNSMVSNSSSDSGVFTEDVTCSGRKSDSRSCSNTSSRNGASRGRTCDSKAMGVLNEWEEVQERSRFTAQTTVNPQAKLHRSMSARLPSRRGKRLSERRNFTEELSALNLSRVTSREPPQATSRHCFDYESELRDCDSNDQGYTSIDSPTDDLDGAEILGDSGSKRSLARKYLSNETRLRPRNHSKTVVCYAGGDEDWEDDDVVATSPAFRVTPERLWEGRRKGLDEMDLYRRSLPRNMRSSRRRILEISQVSHEEGRYLAESDSSHEHSGNSRQCNISRSRRPHSARENRTVPCAFDTNQEREYDLTTRKSSVCSDSGIGKYYQTTEVDALHYRGQYHLNCNETEDCRDWQNVYRDSCNNVPGYEATLRRYSNECAKRPASRQVSQV